MLNVEPANFNTYVDSSPLHGPPFCFVLFVVERIISTREINYLPQARRYWVPGIGLLIMGYTHFEILPFSQSLHSFLFSLHGGDCSPIK